MQCIVHSGDYACHRVAIGHSCFLRTGNFAALQCTRTFADIIYSVHCDQWDCKLASRVQGSTNPRLHACKRLTLLTRAMHDLSISACNGGSALHRQPSFVC